MKRGERFRNTTMFVDRDVEGRKVYLSTKPGRRELGPWPTDNQMLDEAKRNRIRVVTPRATARVS